MKLREMSRVTEVSVTPLFQAKLTEEWLETFCLEHSWISCVVNKKKSLSLDRTRWWWQRMPYHDSLYVLAREGSQWRVWIMFEEAECSLNAGDGESIRTTLPRAFSQRMSAKVKKELYSPQTLKSDVIPQVLAQGIENCWFLWRRWKCFHRKILLLFFFLEEQVIYNAFSSETTFHFNVVFEYFWCWLLAQVTSSIDKRMFVSAEWDNK